MTIYYANKIENVVGEQRDPDQIKYQRYSQRNQSHFENSQIKIQA